MEIELSSLEHVDGEVVNQALKDLHAAKKKAVSDGNEELANSLWLEIEALELNKIYIRAFYNLKDRNYRKAWCELEECEIKCKNIEENSSREYFENSRSEYIKNKVELLQSLYPYCLFASPGFLVGYYVCSICKEKIRPRSRCSHKKGRLYSGELCVHEAHDLQVLEISLVTNPVQKYSVMHDDSTLDFSLIERLFQFLESSFEEWNIEWTTMRFPRERFSGVDAKHSCPCKSGKIFENCCFNEGEIEIPHLNFIFGKEISPEMSEIVFPY